MDPLHGAIEFRPRSRSLAMGGIPWLPRITDKARAMLRGNLGDYIYPWGADKKFLEELGITPEEFTEIVSSSELDTEVVEKMKGCVINNYIIAHILY